jgi:hypothetical protein
MDMNDITLAKFGQIIQKKNVTANISYGSGGFCVTLMDRDTEKVFGGYAWDITEAFSIVINRLEMTVADDKEDADNEKEVPTNPGMRPKKSATVHRLITKEKRKSKRK